MGDEGAKLRTATGLSATVSTDVTQGTCTLHLWAVQSANLSKITRERGITLKRDFFSIPIGKYSISRAVYSDHASLAMLKPFITGMLQAT